MAEPEPVQTKDTAGADKLETEIRWVLGRAGILLRCWTTPLSSTTVDTFTRDDGVSARAFALVLIAALAFAVRGEAGGTAAAHTTFTAVAGGLAVILSAALNTASRVAGVAVRERVILSAYASTILIMFTYAIIVTIGPLYDSYVAATEYVDGTILAVSIAALLIFIGLLAKSLFYDKREISAAGFLHGIALSAGSAAIVWLVARVSSTTWNAIVSCLSKPNPFSCFFSSN